MRKCIVCTVLLLANSIVGMDGIEYLKDHPWFENVSITPTHLTVRTSPTSRWLGVEPNVEIILTPDKEIAFSQWDMSTTISPVSFKDQQKGFRILQRSNDRRSRDWVTFNTAYLALSERPVKVGEDDVEMVMEGGKWVTAEEARRYLELEKLGFMVKELFMQSEQILRDPKKMAEIKEMPALTEAWNKLIEHGYVKTNAADTAGAASPSLVKRWFGKRDGVAHEDGQDNEQSKSNHLWLYVGVSLCALCAILYFMRRKLKT